MAKVTEIVLLTLMPMSSAASLSSETARIALPMRVLPMNSVSATMMSALTASVARASPLMVSSPSWTGGMLTPFGKLCSPDPNTSCARLCKR